MDDIILKAENISKQYRLGAIGTGTLSHDLNRWWNKLIGKEDPYLKIGEVNNRNLKGKSDYVWALKDINFEVSRGEVLGIIGKNGAGKSTLLKILSRVTSPTSGQIKTKGRIASLLEVGTGFHPEMTGRENVYLNGAILGMTKSEITSKLEEIIDFSGCLNYIDTPVKRYSSGMRVRLAFAVAAHLEPDILVIDEVLAVGDAEFQKKAIGKMKDISSGLGRTVLFVSHDMNAISLLTERVIVLRNGMIDFIGNTDEAVNKYLSYGSFNMAYSYEGVIDNPKVVKVKIKTSLEGNTHEYGKPLSVELDVVLLKGIQDLALSIQIIDEFQVPIVHSWNIDCLTGKLWESGKYRFECNFEKMRLYKGDYSLRVHLANSKSRVKYDYLDSVCSFKVQMVGRQSETYNWQKGACKYIEDSNWYIKRV